MRPVLLYLIDLVFSVSYWVLALNPGTDTGASDGASLVEKRQMH